MIERSMASNLLRDDTYRLKWNQKSGEFNLTDEFRNFRDNNAFLDISLAAFSKSGETRLIRAHQIMLSAYSTVFMQMLLQHQPKSEPIIYLKDVTYEELTKLLDFMYQGEVNVLQSELDSLLSVATALRVKGLQGNDTSNSKSLYTNGRELMQERKYQSKRLFDNAFNSFQINKRSRSNFQDVKSEILQVAEYQDALIEPLNEETLAINNNFLENDENDMPSMKDSNKQKKRKRDMKLETGPLINPDEARMINHQELNGSTDQQLQFNGNVDDYIEILEFKPTNGQKFYPSKAQGICKICQKQSRRDDLRKHVMTKHFSNQ